MKKLGKISRLLFLTAVILGLQSCIYEYPKGTTGNTPGNGEDPTIVETFIEVYFDLNWQTMLHNVVFNSDTETKASTEKPHRFIIEVADNIGVVCHDVEYLSEEEFTNGRLRHRLSVQLGSNTYHITVWYDIKDDEGNHSFIAEDLSNVSLGNRTTTNASLLTCAFAHETINLRDYKISEETSVSKEVVLNHPGARFEILATDIQQFITDNTEALNQGDTFTVNLSFTSGTASSFNLYLESVNIDDEDLKLSGPMHLPFAEYDELKIAEGFLFCKDEDEITAKLTITNSSLASISQTESFSFPVKRGYITIISGDFLTHFIDGVFSIDNIWDGEIQIEL